MYWIEATNYILSTFTSPLKLLMKTTITEMSLLQRKLTLGRKHLTPFKLTHSHTHTHKWQVSQLTTKPKTTEFCLKYGRDCKQEQLWCPQPDTEQWPDWILPACKDKWVTSSVRCNSEPTGNQNSGNPVMLAGVQACLSSHLAQISKMLQIKRERWVKSNGKCVFMWCEVTYSAFRISHSVKKAKTFLAATWDACWRFSERFCSPQPSARVAKG